MENTVADPIVYPKIHIAGELVEVKFRCGDIIRLQKDGVDIGEMRQLKGVEAMQQTLKMLSAGIAHQTKKTADELADLIDLAELPAIANAIGEALKKASPQATAQPATTVQ